ncbi:MAG: phosphoribosylanthranilate isomerase [Desulforhabdus sp.]|jgi:phosphoribosylanthranilate isomerase|nr:phosphoribosylanthranilate isomerase [Desulforhabdus sp.]
MKEIIQIAGIRDLAEAQMIAAAGVHQIGFPLRLSIHAEDISEKETAAIIACLPPHVAALLITYIEDAEEIRELSAALGVRRVQLHSQPSAASVARLRRIDPQMVVIKSLIVREENLSDLLADLHAYSPFVDAFITDTYDPVTGASGATGKIHNWDISRGIVEVSRRPVILAGGLNPGNVRDAIMQVRPAGVDVHTGVEGSDGRKDERLVKSFVAEAKAAFTRISQSIRRYPRRNGMR